MTTHHQPLHQDAPFAGAPGQQPSHNAPPPAQPPPISVLLVDDNAMLADAMPHVLRRDRRFEWAGWISNGALVVEQVTSRGPSIVLMDVDMPEIDTFELVRRVVAACPGSRVVMFSGHLREEYIEAAFDAGACGYLHKDDEFPVLLDNLMRIHNGEIVFSPPIERTIWRP